MRAMAQNEVANNSERTFEPKVLRSASNSERYWWVIRSSSGQIVESSHTTYSTKAEALRVANAMARVMRRRG
jgi:hypothetical protein